jgi:hypothetical protein
MEIHLLKNSFKHDCIFSFDVAKRASVIGNFCSIVIEIFLVSNYVSPIPIAPHSFHFGFINYKELVMPIQASCHEYVCSIVKEIPY